MIDCFKISAQISAPGGVCNEDALGYRIGSDNLDVWIIDGATSVADEEYLKLEISDPAWLARSINDFFQNHASQTIAPPDLIRAATTDMAHRYHEQTALRAVPVYAWPVAALVWLRAERRGAHTHISLWSMGDSRFLIQQGDQAPLLFPGVLRKDASPLPGVAVAEEHRSRTGVLMSHVAYERTERERKHTEPQLARMGFHVDSVLHAEFQQTVLQGEFDILGVSDGFYRLVDEYHLYDDQSLMNTAKMQGLDFLYAQLRSHEQSQNRAHAIKKSDDATAILINCL